MVKFLEHECLTLGIDLASVATNAPVAGALTELFQRKRRRLAH
jgi:hypothetical protein